MLRSLLLAALAACAPSRLVHSQTSAPELLQLGPASVSELLDQAQARADARDYAGAAERMQRVVELNPVHPDYWYSLGTTRYHARDFHGAIEAYERAAELGAPLMGAYYSLYNVACCQALAGEEDRALETLEEALDLGFPDLHRPAQDPDLAALREHPRFIELLGLEDVSKMSREEGWRHDLAILGREVRRKGFNRRLYVQRPVTVEEFEWKLRALSDAVPELTDGQIVLRAMELMAFLGDGHSAVWDFGDHPLFKTALPLRFYWLEEGLYVTAAAPEHAGLVGARVLAFDGRPIEQVLEALRPYDGTDRGNPVFAKAALPERVRKLTLLHAAGLVKRPDAVVMRMTDLAGETRDVELAADARWPDVWNQLPAPSSWATFPATLATAPLFVRHVDRAQWFEHLAAEKAVYFQWNKVQNGPTESLDRFAERLFEFVEQNDVEKLVIDLRWNNGGDTALGEALLLRLIGCEQVNQPGKLFVLIGRRTFSAAQNMATYLERFTHATFVGEPTGSSPNFVGEEVPVTLPYSRLMANVSHLFWQSSWPQDQRMWIAPEIYLPPTFADLSAGRDPALAAALGGDAH